MGLTLMCMVTLLPCAVLGSSIKESAISYGQWLPTLYCPGRWQVIKEAQDGPKGWKVAMQMGNVLIPGA